MIVTAISAASTRLKKTALDMAAAVKASLL